MSLGLVGYGECGDDGGEGIRGKRVFFLHVVI